MADVVHFGTAPLASGLAVVHLTSLPDVVTAVSEGRVAALVIDARGPIDFIDAQHLLRALFDDPRRPQRALHPRRVLAVVTDGDVEAAFAFGRYGIACVLEERAIAELDGKVRRALDATPGAESPPLPLAAPAQSARLTVRLSDELPTVTVGYRHAPETLAGLELYCAALRGHARESTVFADVATLIDVLVREGLTCQTNLATKAGTTHSGQFIGSFDYYRELRRTRYGQIPDHPSHAIAMDVFIAIDEVLHEVLHLLFLANQIRAGEDPLHCRIAEELSLTWWQALVHSRVFPEWLSSSHILEINDDFMICEHNQEPFEFWTRGPVFDQYVTYPWIPYVLAQLPARAAYVGQRPDLAELVDSLRARPDAAFLVTREAELGVPAPFDAYPPAPPGLRVAARTRM